MMHPNVLVEQCLCHRAESSFSSHLFALFPFENGFQKYYSIVQIGIYFPAIIDCISQLIKFIIVFGKGVFLLFSVAGMYRLIEGRDV